MMLLSKTLAKIKSRVSTRIFEALYRRMGRFYIEDYPELSGTAFSRIYPTLLCHNIEILNYDPSVNLVYLQKDGLCFCSTPDYPWILREVFAQHIYFIHPKYLKTQDYAVFDFGMNRGYASLYFASQPWCKTVHGFELNEYTFALAQENVALNPGLAQNITLHNYGLGNKDEQLDCYYLPHRDGICTTSYDFLKDYAPEELDKVVKKEIHIQKVSSVMQRILDTMDPMQRIVLKIDVEGAEYDILADLTTALPAFLERVDVLIGEAHMGMERITLALAPFGFKDVSHKNYNPKTQDFLFIRR
jgi:FkbM family methyltransferase